MGGTASVGPGRASAEDQLTIAADVRHLAEVRQFVETRVLALGAGQRTADDLVQAADELTANIILHGYQGEGGEVEVRVAAEGEGVTVTLRDRAPQFDPLSANEPDLTMPLEERPIGGLGIYLSRKLTDELRYRARPGGGNELIIVKHQLADGKRPT